MKFKIYKISNAYSTEYVLNVYDEDGTYIDCYKSDSEGGVLRILLGDIKIEKIDENDFDILRKLVEEKLNERDA